MMKLGADIRLVLSSESVFHVKGRSVNVNRVSRVSPVNISKIKKPYFPYTGTHQNRSDRLHR
jgi:hypothetical protein